MNNFLVRVTRITNVDGLVSRFVVGIYGGPAYVRVKGSPGFRGRDASCGVGPRCRRGWVGGLLVLCGVWWDDLEGTRRRDEEGVTRDMMRLVSPARPTCEWERPQRRCAVLVAGSGVGGASLQPPKCRTTFDDCGCG